MLRQLLRAMTWVFVAPNQTTLILLQPKQGQRSQRTARAQLPPHRHVQDCRHHPHIPVALQLQQAAVLSVADLRCPAPRTCLPLPRATLPRPAPPRPTPPCPALPCPALVHAHRWAAAVMPCLPAQV